MSFGAGLLALWLLLGQGPSQAPPTFQKVFKRGFEALTQGELEAAQAAFQRAQRLQPENPLVYFYVGEIHVRRGQFREAIANFRQAIKLDPSEPQFYFRLSVLQRELERFHDAQETLNDLLGLQPDNPDAYFLLGRVAVEKGNHALAEQHFRHYVRLQPEDPKGLAELGVTLLSQEKLQEGETLLRQALEKDPNSGTAHYNLGLLYSRRGNQLRAKPHLQAATGLLPEKPQTYFQLGTVLVRLGEQAAAEAAFRKAISVSPDYSEAHYGLGTLLRRLGRADEAAQVLAEYERLGSSALEDRQRSRRVSASHLEVRKLLEKDRLEEAEAELREVLELDPRNDLAYYRLAQIYFLRHDYQYSLETTRRALGLKVFEPSYYFLEAKCLERLGREAEAGSAYQRVVELADYPDAHAALARLALRQGSTKQAVMHLRRAVALEPENPEWRLALAEALERAGEHAESRKQRAEAEALRGKSNQR